MRQEARFLGLLLGAALAICASAAQDAAAPSGPGWARVEGQNCWAHIRPAIAKLPATAILTWTGGCAGQQISGNGRLSAILAPQAPPLVMKGAFAQGELNGAGSIDWPDGAHRDGVFTDSVLNGKGVRRTADGLHYTGNFVNGTESGEGHVQFPNGLADWGKFEDGLPNGPGAMSFGPTTFMGDFQHSFSLSGPVVQVTAKGKSVNGVLQPPQRDPSTAQPLPPEPSFAAQNKISFSVTVYLTVLANGQPDNIQIFAPDSLGPDKDAFVSAMRAAIGTWHFLPGRFAGKPLALPYLEKIPYHLPAS